MPRAKPIVLPPEQKIYHITHLDNLPSLASCGCLWSDAEMLRQQFDNTTIGMSGIKKRRIEQLEVKCYAGTKVGEYVPFYFCPRSVMLYLLHMGNAPGLSYKGGQRPIVHLEADLQEVVQWADVQGQKWAFSTSNAGAFYTDFYHHWNDLIHVNWEAVAATDFRDSQIKEGKQAEFLLYRSFPWQLFKTIGVMDRNCAMETRSRLVQATYIPDVLVKPEWYF